VLIDQELVVGAVDRVVQHGSVKLDLDVLHRIKRPVQRERVADLGGHGVTDAFFIAALSDVRSMRVSQRDPYGDVGAALVGEDPEDSRILGQEQRAVGQDSDLALGRSEQPCPDLPRHGPPVRVNRAELVRPCPSRQRPSRLRPQVAFVRVDELGD
jgi:hypothetical protein